MGANCCPCPLSPDTRSQCNSRTKYFSTTYHIYIVIESCKKEQNWRFASCAMYKERSIRWSPFNKNQFFLAPIPYIVLTCPCLVLSDVSPALGSLPQFCVCFMHCYLKSGECKLYYRIYDLSTGGDKEADKAATEVDRVICQRLKY